MTYLILFPLGILVVWCGGFFVWLDVRVFFVVLGFF